MNKKMIKISRTMESVRLKRHKRTGAMKRKPVVAVATNNGLAPNPGGRNRSKGKGVFKTIILCREEIKKYAIEIGLIPPY